MHRRGITAAASVLVSLMLGAVVLVLFMDRPETPAKRLAFKPPAPSTKAQTRPKPLTPMPRSVALRLPPPPSPPQPSRRAKPPMKPAMNPALKPEAKPAAKPAVKLMPPPILKAPPPKAKAKFLAKKARARPKPPELKPPKLEPRRPAPKPKPVLKAPSTMAPTPLFPKPERKPKLARKPEPPAPKPVPPRRAEPVQEAALPPARPATVVPDRATRREGRALLRLLEYGKGPVIEIAWPESEGSRDRLYRYFRQCFGMLNAVMDVRGRLYGETGPMGRPWAINLDRFSGFVRHPSGRSISAERALARHISARHGIHHGRLVRVFPRNVDATILGGLQKIIGIGYGTARAITATYQPRGNTLVLVAIRVNGQPLPGTINMSGLRRRGCSV